MPWRYQPVIVTESDGDESCGICELYFDDSGDLTRWTANPFIYPAGETIQGLTSDLIRMLMDAYSWVPVRFAELRPGMTFERALSQEQREGIARMVETVGLAAKPRI